MAIFLCFGIVLLNLLPKEISLTHNPGGRMACFFDIYRPYWHKRGVNMGQPEPEVKQAQSAYNEIETMRRFALERIADLLSRVAAEVEHAKTVRDEDAIHDLRVTIRRFGRSLGVFSQFVPNRVVKQIKKQLRHLMHLTGEVRNRDITIRMLEKAGLAGQFVAVVSDRELSMRILVSELERWQVEHDAVRWRAMLELPSL